MKTTNYRHNRNLIEKQPLFLLNKNNLKQTTFNPATNDLPELLIPSLENFNYFIQTFTMPSITIPAVDTPYMGEYTSLPGDYITYGDVSCDFLVDEDLQNWQALVGWCKDQAYRNDNPDRMVDITILLKNRNWKTQKRLVLAKAYVTDVSSFSYVTNGNDEDIVICSATFRYQYCQLFEEGKQEPIW